MDGAKFSNNFILYEGTQKNNFQCLASIIITVQINTFYI